jgi:hypothetical protein
VVENIVTGIESPLNLHCKRRTEKNYKKIAKGLEQKGFAYEENS